MLSANSEYFESMFAGRFMESCKKEIVLNEVDPDVFETIIEYMYSSTITITQQNVQVKIETRNFLHQWYNNHWKK